MQAIPRKWKRARKWTQQRLSGTLCMTKPQRMTEPQLRPCMRKSQLMTKSTIKTNIIAVQ